MLPEVAQPNRSEPARLSGADKGDRRQQTLHDRWLDWRDRLLSNSRFQRWAAAFPPTRPIARRRAAALFDLCAGFVYSQILLCCVQLKLFEKLAEDPQTPAQLAPRLSMTEAQAYRLLEAAVALRLLQRRSDGRYGLGPHGAALLGNGGVAEMVSHHALLYKDLTDPLALLRGESGETCLQGFWSYAGSPAPAEAVPTGVTGYSDLMSASQAMIAEELLAAYSLATCHCLMDVGGGQGTFLLAAARRWPHLRLRLFDLPAVAKRAETVFAMEGLAERTTAIGGDFHCDPLPQGADAISLVRIVHDHDDEAALALLKAVRAVLPKGGQLLLAEPMSGTPGAEAAGAAYFGFYLLAMGSGRPRTPAELRALLAAAGYRRSRLVATRQPLLMRLIVAEA